MRGLMIAETVVVLVVLTETYSTEMREYCDGDLFKAECLKEGEVVVVRTALYGRISKSRCLRTSEHIGCRDNVLMEVDEKCSGQKSCQFKVSNATFRKSPCPIRLAMYLEIVHDCLAVATVPSANCIRDKHVLLKNIFHGYIASINTLLYNYGRINCPWRIEVAMGQRINLVLIDFSRRPINAYDHSNHYPLSPNYYQEEISPQYPYSQNSYPQYNRQKSYGNQYEDQPCYNRYGMILDKSSQHTKKICGGKPEREQQLLKSRSNIVEVVLEPKGPRMDYSFLIKFDAIGCAEPTRPRNGWYTHDQNGVWMGCNDSLVTWKMECNEFTNTWYGSYDNCTKELTDKGLLLLEKLDPPHTVTTAAVVILLIIGIVISLILTLLCLEWFKGGRKINSQSSNELSIESSESLQQSEQQAQQQQQIQQQQQVQTHSHTQQHSLTCSQKHHEQQQQLYSTLSKQQQQLLLHQQQQNQQQQLSAQQIYKQVPTTETQTYSQTPAQEAKPKPPGILRNAHNYQQQQYQKQTQQQYQQQQQQQLQLQLQQKPQSILKQQHQLVQPQINFSQESEKQKYISTTMSKKQHQAQQQPVSQTTTLPRNTNDYVREMWPMAPPPASKLEECVRPDSRCEVARSSLFLYGDSVTLNSSAALNSRRSEHDDTHIYETPKYLRKEKAATMRLQPKNQKAMFYQSESKPQDSTPVLCNVEHDFRTTKTLPRKVLTSTDSVKL